MSWIAYYVEVSTQQRQEEFARRAARARPTVASVTTSTGRVPRTGGRSGSRRLHLRPVRRAEVACRRAAAVSGS